MDDLPPTVPMHHPFSPLRLKAGRNFCASVAAIKVGRRQIVAHPSPLVYSRKIVWLMIVANSHSNIWLLRHSPKQPHAAATSAR
jgi:hypothetical protein